MTDNLNPYEAPQSFINKDSASPQDKHPAMRTKALILASVILYLFSFVAPNRPWLAGHLVWTYEGSVNFMRGLIFCWHPICFSWWANPLFWFATYFVLTASSTKALVFSWLSFGFSFAFLLLQGVSDKDFAYIPYYCWMGSMFLAVLAAHAIDKHEKFGMQVSTQLKNKG
jgi:hypothetical protein